ncbi:MAG: GNAT family N-acetyltransferase [Spirochaetales bacterium]|uniref:GNAT family N-acetyltransferase n=1 Tax=Candidatus Thalassospirochaeta sargassi TaxID=3119039 RepID=A0AAJ1IEH3_9SPIO|nr:GNAT family N-acetyltransferase [Spirochaetales bacterium]
MIKLEKMNAADFAAFNEISIRVLAGALEKEFPPAAAAEKAEAEQKELLPDGCDTEGQYLFSVIDSNPDATEQTAGGLWFSPLNRDGVNFAFLFFIFIEPELRGKGIGSTAMELIEAEVEKLGLQAIRLHVLKSNLPAVRVYEKTGYNIFMNYNGYSKDNPGMIMEKILNK